MRKQTVRGLLLLAAMLLIGSAAYLALYELDNKYTAALPGGYGYNLLQSDPRQVAFLVDGWEYYPGQLLAPEDFAAGTTAAAYTYVGEYSNFSQHLGSPYGTATYRLRLVNQGQPVALALYLPELLCAGRVYIDGVLLGKQGYLEPYMPLVMDGVYAFTAGEDTEILIQCANYTHYYSGMYYPPAIGTPTAVARMITARLMVYGLLCFSALAVALYHLAQWLMSQDRLMRWMGLLSLAFALWVCYPFLRSLGVPSVRLLYGVEDISSNIVLLCAIQLAGELPGASVRWYHRRVAVPAGVGLCVFAAIFPFFILPCAPAFINCYGLILFLWNLLAALYLLLLAGYGLKAGQPLERCLLCAAGFYGLSLSVSVLMSERLEPIRGAWADEYGGFALVIGFSAMMVQRGMRLAQENRRLTLHLQEEVDQKTRGHRAAAEGAPGSAGQPAPRSEKPAGRAEKLRGADAQRRRGLGPGNRELSGRPVGAGGDRGGTAGSAPGLFPGRAGADRPEAALPESFPTGVLSGQPAGYGAVRYSFPPPPAQRAVDHPGQ